MNIKSDRCNGDTAREQPLESEIDTVSFRLYALTSVEIKRVRKHDQINYANQSL